MPQKEVFIRMLEIGKDGKVTVKSNSQLLATRVGIAKFKPIQGNCYNLFGTQHVFEKGLIEWDEAGFLPEDYVVERHNYFEENLPPKEWQFVAGKKPEWLTFGGLWHDWIKNQQVQDSAVQFLIRQKSMAPFLDQLVFCIKSEDYKKVVEGWHVIVDSWVRPWSRAKLHRYLHRSNYSPIVVPSMPIKLALLCKGWQPPVPKPDAPQIPKSLVEIPLLG